MAGSRLCSIPLSAGIILGLLCTPVFSLPQTQNSTNSLAEIEHEMVLLLIKKKQFDKALEEACKIFAMEWPAEKEPELLKELLSLSDQFLNNDQHALAIRLLDRNLNQFKNSKSKASIWKEKGYLYKAMGDDDKALDCFREAQRYEKEKK